MKKLICLLLCSTIFTALLARVRTVSNIDSSAQYNNIQDACDASVSNDSIYIGESPTIYPAFTINDKKLAMFGPGWGPFVGGTATVNGFALTGIGATGSELHGLSLAQNSTITIQTAGINNLSFIRNKLFRIQFNGIVSGYIFEGNWFNEIVYNPYAVSLSNFMFRNNIFYGSQSVYNLLGVNLTFTHNLWYGNGTAFVSCQNLTVSNNIFIGKGLIGIANSVFNNNLTFGCDIDAPWAINSNNDGGGNLGGQYPSITAQASVTAGVNNPLLDFSISTGPANNTASDGKDMGLLYDNSSSANWARSRASRLPYISKLNILNQSISKTGKLYFSAEAKSN